MFEYLWSGIITICNWLLTLAGAKQAQQGGVECNDPSIPVKSDL